ncbi:hypothetical protein KP78_13060 [Jeotgalibacillus soli]|uniref:Transcriptional regulator n=1 Tax=Jeotgalibacillus soli TaxID=889306 RepID=A0A0C2W108_9BACL|nr:hypothetical protein KP78_13060 [Jeotgalibacillus soli]
MQEIASIIETHGQAVDQWFFSGQSPYHFAHSQGLITEEHAAYPPLHGTSFFGALLEAQYQEEKLIRSASIDTIVPKEIEGATQFHDFKNITFSTYPYEGYLEVEELVSFHRTRFLNKEADVALTCIHAVQQKLQAQGIPCYRVVPTNIAIQMVFRLLIGRAKSEKYRNAQIAIIGCETIAPSMSIQHEPQHSFTQKEKELDLQKILLQMTRAVQGSLVKMGDGLFFIFSTRGELERSQETSSFDDTVNHIALDTGLQVRMGLGVGATVTEAEDHVRLALQHARRYEHSMIVSVNEDKEIQEHVPGEQSMSFSVRSLGEEWMKRFKEAGISPAIASRIRAWMKRYDKDTISTHDIATWLQSTERNGRRVMAELESIGFVTICGEEQSGGRGRPRKLYRLSE